MARDDQGSSTDSRDGAGSPVSLAESLSQKYALAGICLGVGYWFLESFIHVVIFDEGTFRSELFVQDPHEVWKRLLVGTLLAAFGLYAQHGINVRRRTEAALRTSEQKYRTLIEKALNPVFLFDREDRFVEANQATLHFFDLEREQLQNMTVRDFPNLKGSARSEYDHDSPPDLGQTEMDFTVGGGTKTLLLNIVPLDLEDSTTLYYGIGQDITERKAMEVDLKLAHAELNQIFQTASSAMRVIDEDFTVLKVNQTFADLVGVNITTAVGAKCFDIFAGDRCHTDECPLQQVLGGHQEIEYEISKNRSDGTTVSCLLTARPFVDAGGKPIAIVESFKDITELSRAKAALRTERDKLRNILFQQAEGVAILRKDLTIEYQNPVLLKQIGDCVDGRCFSAFRGIDAACENCGMEEAIGTQELYRCELDTVDGKTFEHTYTPFRDTDGQLKVALFLRDITEVRASRAAAIRSEQLAAVGELAAGVAHEINNPMNGIINYAQMLVNRQRDHSVVKEISQKIVKEGDRVAGIVASLLSFARRGTSKRAANSVQEILSEALTLVGAQLRKDAITLETDIPANLPQVACDQQEIEQVFLNILNNARYALNQKYGESDRDKKIVISADVVDVAGTEYVRVAFKDLGPGIPAEVLEMVTSPFFSTKPKGEGTGLGLSISSEIVSKNAGNLIIESREGEFTTVNIHLPEVKALVHEGVA